MALAQCFMTPQRQKTKQTLLDPDQTTHVPKRSIDKSNPKLGLGYTLAQTKKKQGQHMKAGKGGRGRGGGASAKPLRHIKRKGIPARKYTPPSIYHTRPPSLLFVSLLAQNCASPQRHAQAPFASSRLERLRRLATLGHATLR